MSQVQPETSRFELVSTPNFRIPDNKSSASPFYVPKKADSKAESQIDDVVDEPPAIRRDTPRTKVPQPPKPPSIRRRRTRRVTSVKNNNQQASSKYIGKLCNHELLGRNEEYVLGREIQTLRNWEGVREDLEFQLDRKPTYTEWANAIRPGMTVLELKQQIRRSFRAKRAFVQANIRLVVSTVTKSRKIPARYLVDTIQEGIIGLIRACERFNPELGFRFSSYAVFWIRQSAYNSMLRSRIFDVKAKDLGQLSKVLRAKQLLKVELGRRPTDEEISEYTGIKAEKIDSLLQIPKEVASPDDLVYTNGSKKSEHEEKQETLAESINEDPDANLILANQIVGSLKELVKTLNPREQVILRLRFGFDGHSKTLNELSALFGISRERVRQIESLAIFKLRQAQVAASKALQSATQVSI